MPDPLNSAVCAEYIRALAEPARLRIVEFLRSGARTVTEVAECLGVELGNASHHLRALHHARLVVTRRDGRFIRYSLNPKMFVPGAARKPDAFDFGCCRIELGTRTAR